MTILTVRLSLFVGGIFRLGMTAFSDPRFPLLPLLPTPHRRTYSDRGTLLAQFLQYKQKQSSLAVLMLFQDKSASVFPQRSPNEKSKLKL